MTHYLIFGTETEADARSRSAWTPGDGDTITVRMWDVHMHPSDGRAALVIPDGWTDALTDVERAALVDALPADWNEEEVP